MGRDLGGKEYINKGKGARSKRTSAYDGEGSNFCHSGAYILNE